MSDESGVRSSDDDSDQAGSFTQYKSLIVRNLIIKKREKQKTITEFAMPLYCIAILAIIRIFVKGTIYPPITEKHDGVYLSSDSTSLFDDTVLVTPDTPEVYSLIEEVGKIIRTMPPDIQYFTTEEQLIEAFNDNKQNISAALIFLNETEQNFSYIIRVNTQKKFLVQPSTLETEGSDCRVIFNTSFERNLEDGFTCKPNSYFTSGFLSLQSALDFAIMNLKSDSERLVPPTIFLQSFPQNEYSSHGTTVLRALVPFYMVFAWAQFIIYMMILIVEEKEKKIKEGMKMMGLRGSVYWFSWLTVYFAYVVILAIICVIVLPLANVFQKANLFLLFLLFVLYGLSSIILALMLTPFFNQAKVAGIVGQLAQIFMGLLFYLQVYLSDRIAEVAFWFLALLSPCAFSMGLDKAILFDFSTENGLDWDNIWEGDGLPFAGSLIMISVDIVLYLLLALYFDNVIPSEHGTKQKPWFIFQKSTYTKARKIGVSHPDYSEHKNESFENVDVTDPADTIHPDTEPFPTEWKGREAVRIRNLHKVFKSRGKEDIHAVDGLSMDIYEGQITAILGHNGAGKTTLFNMLTGLTSVTSGTATIYNYDVSDQSDLAELRKLTGVCPQHDILFLTLTPREHLTFYAKIKGVPANLVENKVTEMLRDTDLFSKADTKADDLSGGQKRKLSIGIALVGDPKIVFLDEPTAGVDAYSRRHLWSLLKKNKRDKVILLTTHFMDEADILAERKAIISKGKLRCYGTSMFLKNKFGIGYHLTLVISDSDSAVSSVEKMVNLVIPDADIVRHYGKELSFILPSSSSHLFTKLFKTLDNAMEDAGVVSDIESYGISMTTLEEVFLALNEEAEGEKKIGSVDNIGRELIRNRSPSINSNHFKGPDSNENSHHSSDKAEDFDLDQVVVKRNDWRAFKALVKLRVLNLSREIAALIFLIVFPLGFVVGSMALADSMTVEFANDDLILLNTDLYTLTDNNVALVNNETGENLSAFDSYLRQFHLTPQEYNGSYEFLYNSQPHFSAFDVHSIDPGKVNLTVRYNTSYTHILPILINIVDNAFISYFTGNKSSISTYSQQLPLLESEKTEFDFGTYFSPVMIGFVFTLIPAGLVIDIVYDREMSGQNILRLNGVGFNMYFGSFFLVIGVLYFISYIGLLIIIEAFQVPSLTVGAAYGCVALLYFIYMPSALLFSCCVSYCFDKQETARQFYPSMATTFGFVLYTIVSLVDILGDPDVAFPLHVVFSIFVSYYIPFGVLYYVNKVYIIHSLSNDIDSLTMSDYMTKEIIIMFVICIIDIFFYYILLRIIYAIKLGGNIKDALWIKKSDSSFESMEETEDSVSLVHADEDVKKERSKVLSKLISNSEVTSTALIYSLVKTYGKGGFASKLQPKKQKSKEVTAVKNVSFEVRPGEVFGLLGPNGAGKTSLIRIMNAEERPSKGKVVICGYNITSSLSDAYQYLGYCPQFDCLWNNLHVDEHIECFANISGVRKDQVERLVNKYVKGLEIEEHRKKRSKDCSGGTKRKLCYILSMMGKPKIVLLDEPSTGMDPQSKRFLWNSILASFKGDRCALLTTHSMEEADALCSRIGIMVKGELRCLGSVQHLKNKYGSGYNLELKLQMRSTSLNSTSFSEYFESDSEFISSNLASEDLQNIIKRLVIKTFPNSIIDEEFEERIIFKIPQEDIKSLAEVFSLLEKLKKEKLVEEYALSQTTLEQVFLRFARLQEEEEDYSDESHDKI